MRKLHWQRWLNRPFDSSFIVSLFFAGALEEALCKTGIEGVKCRSILYQNSYWYESAEVWEEAAKQSAMYFKTHRMKEVSALLERFYKQKKKRVQVLALHPEKGEFFEFYEIMATSAAFVWLTHCFEEYFRPLLEKEAGKYVKNPPEFIRSISPDKSNKHAQMEEAIRKGVNAKEIVKEFGWLKSRGFSDGFTTEDINKLRKELKPQEHAAHVTIPPPLKELVEEVKELIYFRTARTDVFYELLFLARPILERTAGKMGISYSELKHYTAQSVLSGKLERWETPFTTVLYQGTIVFQKEPLITDEENNNTEMVQGKVAYTGKVTGRVVIVTEVNDLSKVKSGDILVTQMTFPAYITAMHKAAAFVTDEGGLTCHAAIVAREMKKPCVIGTKVATKVFKDGDLVEVDATKGVVRKV